MGDILSPFQKLVQAVDVESLLMLYHNFEVVFGATQKLSESII